MLAGAMGFASSDSGAVCATAVLLPAHSGTKSNPAMRIWRPSVIVVDRLPSWAAGRAHSVAAGSGRPLSLGFVGLRLGPRRGLRAGREGLGEWAISRGRSRLQGGWPRCDFIKQRGPCGRRLQLVRRRRRGVSESERRRTYDGQIGCGPGLFFGGHCLHRPVALVMPLREPGGASLGCQSRQEHQGKTPDELRGPSAN